MARIRLDNLSHSYMDTPQSTDDYALHNMNLDFDDGGAYALLGPSGCGKTTLLNIISGLLAPLRGQILFDDRDITGVPPEQRNIAQVFQFPVVYDTMSVYNNLAFPLRNRGMAAAAIKQRVHAIADLLEIGAILDTRAVHLSPDNKQRLSMGRGLVRDDVNVIMFDEPLTVIDPHLKWKLRSKIKELHQRINATMIYVTHDQTEALTFADKVVVMYNGQVVQVGTPIDLFERPLHTFVGYFIGSPGMNILPCDVTNAQAVFAGVSFPMPRLLSAATGKGHTEIGIRPEFVSVGALANSNHSIPAKVTKFTDLGRHSVVETRAEGHKIVALTHTHEPIDVGASVSLAFDLGALHVYQNGWLVAKAEAMQ